MITRGADNRCYAPAANRDDGLHRRLKAHAEPITVPVLRLDTSASVPHCTHATVNYLPAERALTALPGPNGAPAP
ncbi:hypothetical protein [Streptomyces spectabilis]|uniref:Uncharacterized protein n=1 Tax=Streptomyces spectabilis TaxID=68270 RepID=A0A7W8B285_STRST|nr:hypothetical protein [Streptomyces spectabilis]MBB5108961.1 hypothetical protein [Streptomyces spectabilis]